MKALVTSLDKPLGLTTKTYQSTNVRATKIDALVRALVVPAGGDRQYRSVTDDAENVMIVTAPDSVHEQIEQVRRVRDERSLQLDIAITVNTFTGSGSEGIPPPRQAEEITSQVIVPDGHTVILGGFNRGSKFIFIGPIILQDDKFKDLGYLSEESVRGACLPADYPKTQPVWIR